MASAPPKGQIYDAVASDYDVIWNVGAVKMLFPLLDDTLKSLGPWEGRSVLDLACGTGIGKLEGVRARTAGTTSLTRGLLVIGLREMKKLGATTLVGVDISSEMLEVAKATGGTESGFHLHHADCSQPLTHLGLQEASFDLVIGMWLLNYPESSAQMKGMWENISQYLKPGGEGKFVGIIQNQDTFHPTSMQGKMSVYGAQETNVVPLENGEGVRMHVEFDTVPKVEFDTFVLKKEILEGEAEKAGIKRLRYVRAGEEVKGTVEGKDDVWWDELLREYPNQIVIAESA